MLVGDATLLGERAIGCQTLEREQLEHRGAATLALVEALSVGDAAFRAKCKSTVNAMIQTGITVLFVSHSPDGIRDFCTRAVYLKNGTIVGDGDVDSILELYKSK